MNKAELESKHLSDLHALAAEAGVERFRMLSRAELIEKLSGGDGGPKRDGGEAGEQRGERPRRRRRRGTGDELGDEAFQGGRSERDEAAEKEEKPARSEEPARAEKAERQEPARSRPAPPPAAPAAEPAKPKRRRRRRRFGRRGKEELTIQTLLLPPEPGRQAILYGESREACTALLRGVAAELSDSKGPDPVALLIDPSPEELADWKREAPQAEIVSAGQPRHADDALAQASARAGGGEDVMLLVDSLTRLAAASGDAEAAKDFFDAGRTQAASGGGTLTVVAALERPA